MSALRAALRSGSLSEGELHDGVVRLAEAVEMSLRRLLRDLPAAPMETRLSALAPDELTLDEVVAGLRQHDRIPLALGASVHELQLARQRLAAGGPLEPGDGALAARVADALEHEIAEHAAPRHAVPVTEPPAVDETLVEPIPVESAERRRRSRAVVLSVLALLVLALFAGGVWWALARRGAGEMERGVELFRAGSYMDAASHFWRYAEAHPRDPLPHVYLARIHRRLQRFDLAAQEVKKAVTIAPEDPAVLAEMGFLLLDTGRYAESVQRFRAALAKDAESREAWVGLVLALRAGGRPDAAQRVLERAPADVRALAARPAPPDTLP